ncbi:MAG: hypothetical protein IPL61_22870, partial [Myxococcales bacterium]|nr:hypothetical protein [Myxococcales bacterium]
MEVIVTAQVPVPEQPPSPRTSSLADGVAVWVSVTVEPWLIDCAEVVPQPMPAGDEVTVRRRS